MDPYFYCSKKEKATEYCPGPNDTVAHFTQITVNGSCEIPEPKPNSEKLIEAYHKIEIHKAITVDSVEFKRERKKPGKKVVVAGNIELGIEYSANEPEQKVHFFKCTIPFSAFILRCKKGKEHLFSPEFCLEDYFVHICVEHIEINQVTDRSFEKIMVLMIWLQPRN